MWKDLDLERMAEEENTYSLPRSRNEIEEIVVFARCEMHNKSQPCGAKALWTRLNEHYHLRPLPSIRTIGRILTDNGLTDGMRTRKRSQYSVRS